MEKRTLNLSVYFEIRERERERERKSSTVCFKHNAAHLCPASEIKKQNTETEFNDLLFPFSFSFSKLLYASVLLQH